MKQQGVARISRALCGALRHLSVVAICILATVGLIPLHAAADSFTVTGPTSFDILYSFLTPLNSPLTATGTYNVTSFSSSEVLMNVTIQNTTPNYVVSSVGFNTTPAVTASFTSPGSVFDGVANDTNFPSFQTIQVCAFTSANCSSSTNAQALQANSSDTFGLKLTGAFSPSLTLSTFAIKFAGGPEGSFEFQGNVPVPGTMLLFGAGFALLVAWHQRSRPSLNGIA